MSDGMNSCYPRENGLSTTMLAPRALSHIRSLGKYAAVATAAVLWEKDRDG